MKFKPAGSKEYIDYEGDRSLESLVAFVEANAKNSLEIPEVKAEEPAKVEEPVKAEEPAAQTPLSAEEPKATEAHDEL